MKEILIRDGELSAAGRVGVLAVDDQPAFRGVVRELVDATEHLTMLAEADCAERALELADRLHPALVLMDVRMPGIGGLAGARAIKQARPTTVVVLISTTYPDDLPREAAQCDADEIVWKTDLRPGLLDDIWRRHGRGG